MSLVPDSTRIPANQVLPDVSGDVIADDVMHGLPAEKLERAQVPIGSQDGRWGHRRIDLKGSIGKRNSPCPADTTLIERLKTAGQSVEVINRQRSRVHRGATVPWAKLSLGDSWTPYQESPHV